MIKMYLSHILNIFQVSIAIIFGMALIWKVIYEYEYIAVLEKRQKEMRGRQ